MKKNKIFLLLVLGIFLIGIVSATNYCCERTTTGASCQDVTDRTLCSSGSKIISTPCESTSYCKEGTCIDQKEGTCMPSTQVACQTNNGFWSEKLKSELPQCALGCCLIGDSASFVTQVSCNKQSSDNGVKVNYQANINDELTCLAMANPEAKGACVYTKDYTKTCEITTKKDCQDKAKSSTLSGVEFHEGYLCSAQELETGCGKSTQTTCGNEGNVYFVDTCGNKANIYDASKVNDENYWTKINYTTSCDDGKGNKDSATCGACDYYSGSMCREKKTGDTVTYGDNLCKNLDCKDYTGLYSGGVAKDSYGRLISDATHYPKHGESWCATNSQTGDATAPGASSFKLTCYNGEVNIPEECGETSAARQLTCLENDTDTTSNIFMHASCLANNWRDCTSQTTQSDCENINVRDCVWRTDNMGYSFDNVSGGVHQTDASGLCVPKYPSGFDRDASSTVVGGTSCGQSSSICYVKMKSPTAAERLFGKKEWTCSGGWLSGIFGSDADPNNCSCIGGSEDQGQGWGKKLNNAICTHLGDCGNKKNYVGAFGYAYNPIQIQTVSS
jgi:hypothetical protein